MTSECFQDLLYPFRNVFSVKQIQGVSDNQILQMSAGYSIKIEYVHAYNDVFHISKINIPDKYLQSQENQI